MIRVQFCSLAEMKKGVEDHCVVLHVKIAINNTSVFFFLHKNTSAIIH